ncbi:MAG: hypothetical protein N4A49_09675 [Marinifilaceae bacterium]|jgi:hypothetical protein|nr:hypothetical protein [Marinifilaceae bacterium]
MGPDVEKLHFYIYDGNSYKFIPKADVIPVCFDDFLKGNKEETNRKMGENEDYASLIFQLPQHGKNIIAKFGNFDSYEIYTPYIIGNRMILVWDDGRFKRSEIYWEKK